jgi:4-amino-4-deoxy-L-arabinose transferase-like glycosyltransferase
MLERFGRSLETWSGIIAATTAVIALHVLYLELWPLLPVHSDAMAYHSGALSLLSGRGYLNSNGGLQTDFMPAYSIFLSQVYRLLGPPYPAAGRIGNAVLCGLTAALLCRIALRLFGRRAAAAGFLLVGLTPALFIYVGMLYAEIFVITMTTLLLWLAVHRAPAAPGRFAAWAAGCGAAVGVLALAKPELCLWLLVPPLVVLGHERQRARPWPLRRALLSLIVAAVAFGAVLSPWVLRNQRIYHRPVLFSTAGGRTLWLSAHKPQLYEYAAPEFDRVWRRCHVPGDLVATDHCLRLDAARMILDHPVYFAGTSIRRVFRLFAGSHTEHLAGSHISFAEAAEQWRRLREPWPLVLKGGLLAINAAFLAVAFLGLVSLRRERRFLFLFYMVGVKVAVHAIFFGTPRYSLHLFPLLALCAAAWLGRHVLDSYDAPPPGRPAGVPGGGVQRAGAAATAGPGAA